MADRKKNRAGKRKSAKTRRPLMPEGVTRIDVHDIETLKKFTTDLGKIMPRRLTGVPPKTQRELARAIKRARIMGLVR